MNEQEKDAKKLEIGSRIRELRKRQQLSMDDFAKLIGSTSATVSNLENGVSMPGGDTLLRITEATAISADWLLTGVGAMQRSNQVGKSQTTTIFFDDKWHFFCQFNERYRTDEEERKWRDLVTIIQSAATCSNDDLQLLLSLAERIAKK